MIDKKRVGRYLKKLRMEKKRKRDGKPYSLEDLASDFSIKGIEISTNAISEWENGKSLPSYDNLEILSTIYDKSIDEILDGEDKKEIDYSTIYFLYSEINDKNKKPFEKRNEQIKLITHRFKELIMIRIRREFTQNEEKEFKYLFNNYYSLTEYAKEYSRINQEEPYLILKDAIRKTLVDIRNMNKKEKFWEIQKLYTEKENILFSFRVDVHDMKFHQILKERYKELEDWQKDMLLAMFQNILPYNVREAGDNGAGYLKWYENSFGPYDFDTLVKDLIRELINGGACVNKYFLNVKKQYVETKRIIDRLEELYNLCLKPIEVHLLYDGKENNKIKSFKIENNCKNRFLNEYYYILNDGINEKSTVYENTDDLYEWFINTNELTKKDYLKLARKHDVNTEIEEKYWMSNVKAFSKWFLEKFDEFKKNEEAIKNGLIEIEELEQRLENGEKFYQIIKYEIIGGKDESSIRNHIEYWKQQIDYSTYLKERNKKITEKLLKDLDVLSLQQIREKYFNEEVIDNE